ncbi:hypothetical protein EAI_12098, partial [Harpegnathos saltator]
LAIDGDGLTNIVFEKVRTNDAAGPKSAPNSNFLWMHCYLLNLVWVGVVPYTAIMLVNIAIHQKMRLVAKDDFSAKIGVLFQMLRSPVSEQTALSMVINFELLGQLDLV